MSKSIRTTLLVALLALVAAEGAVAAATPLGSRHQAKSTLAEVVWRTACSLVVGGLTLKVSGEPPAIGHGIRSEKLVEVGRAHPRVPEDGPQGPRPQRCPVDRHDRPAAVGMHGARWDPA